VAKKSPRIIDLAGPARESAPPRPFVSLDGVIGQDAAVSTLTACLESDRVHHAWIFSGPPGVGKFTTAEAFAAYLLDPTTQPDLSGRLAPDPESPVQRLVRADAHPDLHVIRKELAAVSAEQKTRDGKQIFIAKAVIDEFLIEPSIRTRVMPGDSRAAKVFIIDEAELLNAATQNSLLKTIEEPPAGTVVILVTSSEHRLLPTIRSRCQRVQFGVLSDPDMEAWIKRSGVDLDPARREWLLGFAAGSPGMAKMAVDHDLFKWREVLDPLLRMAAEGPRYPIELGSTMHQLVEEQAASWVKKNPDASKDAANKAWARRLLGYVGEYARRSLGSGVAGGSGSSSGGGSAGWALTAIDAVVQAEEELGGNVNMTFVFENLAAKIGVDAPAARR